MNRPGAAALVVSFGSVLALELAILPLMPRLGPDLEVQADRGIRGREILDGVPLRPDPSGPLPEPPLYGFFLAPFFLLAQPLPAIQVAQAALLASAVFPLGLFLGERLRPGRETAVLVVAMLPAGVLLSPFRLGPEALLVPLLAWWLEAARRVAAGSTPLAALVWGFLTGLAVLAVDGALLLFPLLAWAILSPRRAGLSLLVASAGLATVLAPWLAGGWRPGAALPTAGSLGASAGALVLGTGVFLLPAVLAEILRPARGLLAACVLALAVAPGASGPPAVAALLPPLVALGLLSLGRSSPFPHGAAAFLALAFSFSYSSDAGPPAEFAGWRIGAAGVSLILLWLVGSAWSLARLEARRMLLALALLGVVLPAGPRVLGLRRALEGTRGHHEIGRWFARRGPDGPVHVAGDPELASIIAFESGRVVAASPDQAVLLLAADPLPGRRAIRTFRLADGSLRHVYSGPALSR